MKKIEKFNHAYDFAKDYFGVQLFSIHSLLWQIMINESLEGKKVAFHPNVKEDGIELVLADADGGYTPTSLMFLSNDYDQCCLFCDQLNIKVFALEEHTANRIVSKSMNRLAS